VGGVSGKLFVIMLIGFAAAFGGALWYFQTYAWYEPVAADDAALVLTPLGEAAPEPMLAEEVRAIDAATSPLKFRACFRTPMSLAMLTETYRVYERATPLTAPGWFDCFDARRLTEDLESGAAIAFLGAEEASGGADLVIAVYDDGRAYAWRQLNARYADQ
jgi:hypothetical protein